MPKCWIHGETQKKETETTSKPLKEQPFHDKNSFQQNLSLILAPHKPIKESLKTYRWWDFQVINEENKDLKGQVEIIPDLKDNLSKKETKLLEVQTQLQEKQTKIKDLKDQITEIQKIDAEEINKLRAENTKKDDRIIQLEKQFKGMIVVLKRQENYIDHQKEQLETESKEKGISQDQAKHLQEDITRLDKEKEELTKQIKELTDLDAESRKLRDKELEELKEKATDYEKTLKELEKLIIPRSVILFPRLERLERLERLRNLGLDTEKIVMNYDSWTTQFPKQTPEEVQKQITTLTNEKDNMHQQLQKELGWWDKWINDKVVFTNGIMHEISESTSYYKKVFGDLNENEYSWTVSTKIFGQFPRPNNKGIKEKGNEKLNIVRKLVKVIYEYYKNKP